ncbi:hypothetical protein RhiirA1_457549 [Rhizophagus irregularis]|uniref:Uncharacterized protein n=1 Tax=Rhizophagus irregularis TaxID=588596 RepID=A0A2I1FNH3_9GLOM|nr:hypothetical protein RhiirA1_457549 [Rhizophagus irregularis]PKY35940.1 hypothetical protein RhiirB3_457565 [Rhizophagus irregularis]
MTKPTSRLRVTFRSAIFNFYRLIIVKPLILDSSSVVSKFITHRNENLVKSQDSRDSRWLIFCLNILSVVLFWILQCPKDPKDIPKLKCHHNNFEDGSSGS